MSKDDGFVPFPVDLEIDPTPRPSGAYEVRWPGGRIVAYKLDDPQFRYGVTVPEPPWTDPWGLGITEEEARFFVRLDWSDWSVPALLKLQAALQEVLP